MNVIDGVYFINDLVLPVSNQFGGLPVYKINMTWHDTDGWCLIAHYVYNGNYYYARVKITESVLEK